MLKGHKAKQENQADIFIKTPQVRFRLRACGIIIKDGAVLMVKNNIDDYFYSVGGAIQLGETIKDACLREVLEETGYPYEIDRLVFIHENFFTSEDILWHEIAYYFLMKENNNTTFSISYGSFGAKETKVWLPIDAYHNYKAYPKFFSNELKNIPENIKVITTFE